MGRLGQKVKKYGTIGAKGLMSVGGLVAVGYLGGKGRQGVETSQSSGSPEISYDRPPVDVGRVAQQMEAVGQRGSSSVFTGSSGGGDFDVFDEPDIFGSSGFGTMRKGGVVKGRRRRRR